MTKMVKMVAGSAANAVGTAMAVTEDLARNTSPADTKALAEAMTYMAKANAILAAVATGRVEARAKFTMLKAA